MLILSIAVIIIGVVILPDALLLMTWRGPVEGEHMQAQAQTLTQGQAQGQSHYSGKGGITAIDRVMAELRASGAHRNFSCQTCHHSPFANFDFHIECLDCHGHTGNISGHWTQPECQNCSICHWRCGNNITAYKDFVSVDINGGHEALIRAAEANTQLSGANEACIACHTGVNVSVSVPKTRYLALQANMEQVSDFDFKPEPGSGSTPLHLYP